jgi:hypothetical protein
MLAVTLGVRMLNLEGGRLAPKTSRIMNYFSGQQGNEHLVPSDSKVVLPALPSAN